MRNVPLKDKPPISDLRSPSLSPSLIAADATRMADPTVQDRSNCIANAKEKPRPQSRPTFFGSEIERIAQNEAGARLIAKLLREVLTAQRFADPGQLREAVEARCQTLGLTCSRDQIERALDLVGSNTPLLTARRMPARRAAPTPEPPTIKPAEATSILQSIGVDVSGGRVQRSHTRSRLVPM